MAVFISSHSVNTFYIFVESVQIPHINLKLYQTLR